LINHLPIKVFLQNFLNIIKSFCSAYLTYELNGDTIDFQHTFVPPKYRGQSIAEKLVRVNFFTLFYDCSIRFFAFQGALNFVDNESSIKKIIPTCTYVAKFLTTKAPQYARYLPK
jgi:predicted GNAT family acetyltransferase